jgi:hypothetical protein
MTDNTPTPDTPQPYDNVEVTRVMLMSIALDNERRAASPGTQREIAAILRGVCTAIVLDRTDELAALVKRWQDGKLTGMVSAAADDDQQREDAVDVLRLPSAYTGIG